MRDVLKALPLLAAVGCEFGHDLECDKTVYAARARTYKELQSCCESQFGVNSAQTYQGTELYIGNCDLNADDNTKACIKGVEDAATANEKAWRACLAN